MAVALQVTDLAEPVNSLRAVVDSAAHSDFWLEPVQGLPMQEQHETPAACLGCGGCNICRL